MKIFLNGKEKDRGGGISCLNERVNQMLKDDRGKIIELNGRVIKRAERDGILLKEGDRIELIQFMGGG